MGVETAAWMLGLAVMVGLVVLVYRMMSRIRNLRLMRCPETGSITIVRAERVASGDGQAQALTVLRCGLWPERKNCDRGCLARYDETTSGYRVNLRALRPFDHRGRSKADG